MGCWSNKRSVLEASLRSTRQRLRAVEKSAGPGHVGWVSAARASRPRQSSSEPRHEPGSGTKWSGGVVRSAGGDTRGNKKQLKLMTLFRRSGRHVGAESSRVQRIVRPLKASANFMLIIPGPFPLTTGRGRMGTDWVGWLQRGSFSAGGLGSVVRWQSTRCGIADNTRSSTKTSAASLEAGILGYHFS
jgi:hypothetical protein